MAWVRCLGGSRSGKAFLLPSDGQPHCILHTHHLNFYSLLRCDGRWSRCDSVRPRMWQKPAAGSPAKGDQSPGANLVPIPARSPAARVSGSPPTQACSPLQCTELQRGRNGVLITSLALQVQNYSPASASAVPRHPSPVPCPPAELQPGRGRFWEKASLPDVSSVAFKASQNLLSAHAGSPPLLPSLPVPQGTRFLLSPALGWRGSSDRQLEVSGSGGGGPGAAQARGTRELPARLRIVATHAHPRSSIGHHQPGVEQEPRVAPHGWERAG